MIKFVKQRNPKETNLLPVLAMLLDTNIGDMLRAAGFSSDYSPQDAQARWTLAKEIAERNGMQWFLQEMKTEIHMSEHRLTVPSNGSGIIFTWSIEPCGGLADDGTIKSVCVVAFDSGLVFDPCAESPIPALHYQQILDECAGKVVRIVYREGGGS
jgi:hypothetical protein